MKKNGQADRLFEHLLTGESIHRWQAAVDLGIMELSARVIDLEKEGFVLPRYRKTITNQWGESTSVAIYSLDMSSVLALQGAR